MHQHSAFRTQFLLLLFFFGAPPHQVKSSAADQFRGRTLLLHVNKQSGVRLDDGDDELFSLPWKESILCEISPGDHNRLTILTVEGFEFPLETWSHETSDAIFLTIDAFSGDYDLAARPDTGRRLNPMPCHQSKG